MLEKLKNVFNKKIVKERLFTKSRLIILNEDTFEEMFSLPLTLMNVFVVATISAIAIITLTTFFIAFTPLREYIPGYASDDLRKEALQLAIKSDSLSSALKKNEAYLHSVVKVLNGDLEYANVNQDSILAKSAAVPSIDEIQRNDADEELRKVVADDEKAFLKTNKKKKNR